MRLDILKFELILLKFSFKKSFIFYEIIFAGFVMIRFDQRNQLMNLRFCANDYEQICCKLLNYVKLSREIIHTRLLFVCEKTVQ